MKWKDIESVSALRRGDGVTSKATGELHQDMSAFRSGSDTLEYYNSIAAKPPSLFATSAQGGGMIGGLP